MKRTISLLLIIIMLSSLILGCVHIEDDLEMKKAYLRQFGIKDVEAEDVVIDYDGGVYNGARIVMLDAERHEAQTRTDLVMFIKINYYDSNQLYAYKNGVFFSLNTAVLTAILSLEDIQKIIRDFNASVTHFRDTCDVHDFDEFWFWDNEIDASGTLPLAGRICVDIDSRVVYGDDFSKCNFNVVEYLGSDLIVKLFTGYYGDQFCRFFLDVDNEDLENIPYIIDQIDEIPGVLSAGYYYSYMVLWD